MFVATSQAADAPAVLQAYRYRRRAAYHLRTRCALVSSFSLAFVAFLGVGVVAAAYFYDDSKKNLIAEGVKVNGVPIGGLTRAAGGEEALARRCSPRWTAR